MKRVLVVDNERLILAFMDELLSKEGYQVVRAKNGLEALDILKTYRAQIMFVDMVMPKMDVSELVAQLQAFLPETKVLLISGYTDETIARHGALNSGQAFLEKPFSPRLLPER